MQCKGGRILLFGYNGKMGKTIRSLLPFGSFHTALNFEALQKESTEVPQVCIDFSSPVLLERVIETCQRLKIPLVSGTTGFSEEQLLRLKSLSSNVPVVHSNNFSVGMSVLVNVLPSLVSQLPGFDIAIVEQHHRHKKDKPSGTAKTLLKKIEQVKTRSGQEEFTIPIPIHSIRAGGIIGEHTVIFCNEEEKISITHNAFSRKTFAQGALWTAKRLCEKKLSSGLYTLQDILLL